jgi:hypothetical protein
MKARAGVQITGSKLRRNLRDSAFNVYPDLTVNICPNTRDASKPILDFGPIYPRRECRNDADASPLVLKPSCLREYPHSGHRSLVAEFPRRFPADSDSSWPPILIDPGGFSLLNPIILVGTPAIQTHQPRYHHNEIDLPSYGFEHSQRAGGATDRDEIAVT